MPNPNSVIRRKEFKQRELEVVTEIISIYKQRKWKVLDGIESVMIQEPDSTFRVFISRISHSLQFYFLGEGSAAKEIYLKYLDSPAKVLEEEKEFKKIYG
jgi:hypothetical protein